jgi:hypothetical protein
MQRDGKAVFTGSLVKEHSRAEKGPYKGVKLAR